jgi:ribonuclease D
VLLEIATTQPEKPHDLARIDGLAEKTARRAGAELLEIVARSKTDTSEYQPPPRPDEQQKTMLKKAQAIVTTLSSDLGIAAELLAPKKELTATVFGEQDSRVFRGWRKELIGDELRKVLNHP